MAMSVTLGECSADDRAVTKGMANQVTVNCKPYENCSVLYPKIIIKYFGSISNKNYMYISDFGRYYYITDVEVMPGSEVLVTGAVDVLYTYSEDIKSSVQLVVRSADDRYEQVKYSKVVDSMRPVSGLIHDGRVIAGSNQPINSSHCIQYILTTIAGIPTKPEPEPDPPEEEEEK